MNHHEQADLHALTGAYAVDALDDLERARFEAHLEHCADCRTEVAELRATAALLADDAAVPPPPALRSSVLDAIATVRPLPPLPEQHAAGTTTADTASTSDTASAAGATGTTGPAHTNDAGAPAAVSGSTGAAARRARRLWGSRTLLVAAAVAVLALVAGAAWLRPWAEEPDTSVVAATATERVLQAEDATRVSQRLADGAKATVVLSRSEGRAVIFTEAMPPAPEGSVYELWLQTPEGAMVPAGLMPDDSDATVLLDGDASEATGVGITVEPDGGSAQPTTEPIALFPLEA